MINLKKIIASLATVATLGMTGIPVLASTGEEVHSGMVENVEDRSSLLRETQERDGGIWNYGVGKVYVWSYYQHKHRLHRSSVQPGHGAQIVRSDWKTKGIQSRASAPKAPSGNSAYYDIK